MQLKKIEVLYICKKKEIVKMVFFVNSLLNKEEQIVYIDINIVQIEK